MPIFKKEIKSDFTVVHNAFIRDENLGIAARGLLLTMLSMSDGWNFSVKGLAAILPDGECKVTTAIRELERKINSSSFGGGSLRYDGGNTGIAGDDILLSDDWKIA